MTAVAVTPFTVPDLLDHLLALSLRHDELGQEIILNEILRQLLERKEFEQSERIIANCELKQPYRSTNQAARFFYYVALTHATRLDYVSANHCISQTLRKAPASNSKGILGFRIAATKLFLTIQLLLGEIPPRSEFISDSAMKEALAPYMQLTSCVRFGNLGRFLSLVKQHHDQLEHDRTLTLISRVRQNVIKTGLRRICQAYCRISLSDICVKLALENPGDAEYIVGKAIRDGVVEATIDHDNATVTTSESIEVYNTTMEPLQAFQRRVQFLNTTHEEAIRAMRYVGNIDAELDLEKKKKESKSLGDGGDVVADDDESGVL